MSILEFSPFRIWHLLSTSGKEVEITGWQIRMCLANNVVTLSLKQTMGKLYDTQRFASIHPGCFKNPIIDINICTNNILLSLYKFVDKILLYLEARDMLTRLWRLQSYTLSGTATQMFRDYKRGGSDLFTGRELEELNSIWRS